MSKIDQLRRQREAHSANQAGEAPVSPRAVARSSSAGAPNADALEGKCAVCGKLRALQGGLVTSHQKGLGKMCPGSRKEPAA